MNDQILNALAIAAGPQTGTELHDALKRSGIRVDEFQVLQELRRLQKNGVVRLEGVRWRLLKVPTTIIAVSIPKSPAVAPRAVSESSAAIVVPTRTTAPAVPSTTPVGRWSLFRRLCRYYMDCVVQEEAPQLRGYVDNEDDTWIAVREVPWLRLVGNVGFAVSLAKEQAPFQRNRVRRGDDECVYLGYPVLLIKPAQSDRFIVPLFVQPMQADWKSGVLSLKPDGPIAVNGAWLDYRFRQRTERESFLRAMGLLSDLGGDDEDAEPTPVGPKDFASLAQDAAHYMHDADRFAQDIQPFALGDVTNWKQQKPGLYNSAVLMLGPRLRYTKSLMRDLRDISDKISDAELDQTALASLFPHEPPAPEEPKSSDSSTISHEATAFAAVGLAQTRLLHPSQRSAVSNALTVPASVVTGPPGTGKSEVVAAMLLNQLLRGRATLFASKNHQALDAVLPRLNEVAEVGELIIRTSSRDLAQRQNYLVKLQSLLALPPRPDVAKGDEYRRQFAELFNQQAKALEVRTTLERARREYEDLNRRIEGLLANLPSSLRHDEALHSWPRGITTEVIAKLEVKLRASLARPKGWIQRLWHRVRRHNIESRRQSARESLIEFPLASASSSLPDATADATAWNDCFKMWRTWAEAAHMSDLVKNCERHLAQLPSSDECNRRLADIQQSVEVHTRQWKAWAAGGVRTPVSPTDRETLTNLRAGIQNWGVNRFAKELKRHFNLILQAFPLWSVSNLSARSALPLVPGLFELVIIDEASQCDIASVVPLLARSRRAVFVGDPMQLRHISTLNPTTDQTLLEQHGLTETNVQRFTYRVNSAFDLADANSAVPEDARVRLDLHFRSHELIADYCNEAFYSKTLHVLTATERLNIPDGVKPGIHWTHVVGTLEAGPTGARCSEEVEVVKGELIRLAASGYRGTVGVVTPFRQQMIRLKDALESCDGLPRDFLERVRLVAATAHGFQGDERDLILFSLCAGPEMPEGSKVFLRENPNLFNVAVSRARAVLHVVGNRDWALNCGVPFIAKLARRTLPNSQVEPDRRTEPYQSPWEKTLDEALRKVGIRTVPQYPIAGRFLDLAVLEPRKIDIEVDGESVHRTAGGGRKDDDHWRDLQLQSLDWKVCRFWVYELRENMARCVARVARLLEDE